MDFFKTSDDRHHIIPIPEMMFNIPNSDDSTPSGEFIPQPPGIVCKPSAFSKIFKQIKENRSYNSDSDHDSDFEYQKLGHPSDYEEITEPMYSEEDEQLLTENLVGDEDKMSEFVNMCSYSFPEYKTFVEKKINKYSEDIRKKERELEFYRQFNRLVKELKDKRSELDVEINKLKNEIENIM